MTVSSPSSDLSDEMRHAVMALGGPRGCGETMERVFDRAAGAADISVRAARALFYREARNPAARVVDNIRSAMARREAASARRDALLEETARAKRERAIDRLSGSIETAIYSTDADEVRDLLIRLFERVDRIRGQDSAVGAPGADGPGEGAQ